MRTKYVIVGNEHEKLCVAFSGTVNHSDIARALKTEFPGFDVKSAGIVTLVEGPDGYIHPSCMPGSVTLGIPLDASKAEEDNHDMFYGLTKAD